MKPYWGLFLLLAFALPCSSLFGATLSISKDVRFTVGSPRVLFDAPPAIPELTTSCRDGGNLVAAPVWANYVQTGALLVRRLDATGVTVWTRDIGEINVTHYLNFIMESATGEVIVGEQIGRGSFGPAVARMVKLDQLGEVLMDTSFGAINFSRMVPDGDGYIIGGNRLTVPNEYREICLLRIANDFRVEWQTNIHSSVYVGVAGPVGLIDLKRTPDGGLLYAVQHNGLPSWLAVKSRLNGTIEWKVSFSGVQINGANERLVGAYPLREGGHVLLYSSTIPPGLPNPSPGFGGEDYRIIRVNTNGQTVWTRYYGGIENDEPRFLAQTEDGGFIVGGYSRSVNISGNKGVAGTGTWVLKLDSLGLKEAEFLLPGDYSFILPKATGYSLVGAGTDASYTTFSAVNLDALRRVSITAQGSLPFNVDVSSNLVDWTPLVIGLTGEFHLLQSYTGDRKFYRAVEPSHFTPSLLTHPPSK